MKVEESEIDEERERKRVEALVSIHVNSLCNASIMKYVSFKNLSY